MKEAMNKMEFAFAIIIIISVTNQNTVEKDKYMIITLKNVNVHKEKYGYLDIVSTNIIVDKMNIGQENNAFAIQGTIKLKENVVKFLIIPSVQIIHNTMGSIVNAYQDISQYTQVPVRHVLPKLIGMVISVPISIIAIMTVTMMKIKRFARKNIINADIMKNGMDLHVNASKAIFLSIISANNAHMVQLSME